MLEFSSVRYGGDFNPEHWPLEKIDEDVELMRRAGVNLVSIGIFGWGTAEPVPGEFDFSLYRHTLDRLHANGIGVSLATMTASPPPWLTHQHPEILPQLADGTVLSPGARQHYCPSSPVLREAVSSMVSALADELGDHPAVALWHLNNEYGCHIRSCWCDVSAEAFRGWLRSRYGTIDELNRAWTTTFWSQHYSDWAEILPPRKAPTFPNNAQQLDFARWSSQELQSLMRVEIDILRQKTPHVPLTTNFAAVMPPLDLWEWTKDLDVVSFDSYPDPSDPQAYVAAAFDYDVIRSMHGGKPWLLMEQAPSAVNWRRRNAPKPAGRMRVGSWQAVAHGADAVMFFQWRASPGGAEKFHSAMVGHTGPASRGFSEITALGAELAAHPQAVGLDTRSDTALLLDWESWWAGELDSHPTGDLTLRAQMLDWYRVTSGVGIPTDAVHPAADLSDYRLLIAPSLYLLTAESAANLIDWVKAGGVLVLSYFTSVADKRDRLHAGGAPGPLRDAVGATVQEWWPLQEGDQVQVRIGDALLSADIFTEDLMVNDAEVLGTFVSGELSGGAAVLRNTLDEGTIYYVGARLDDVGTGIVLQEAMTTAGLQPLLPTIPAGVEVVQRGTGDQALLFVLNHTATNVEVALDRGRVNLLAANASAALPNATLTLERYGVAMLR